jgi:hypothetical protein
MKLKNNNPRYSRDAEYTFIETKKGDQAKWRCCSCCKQKWNGRQYWRCESIILLDLESNRVYPYTNKKNKKEKYMDTTTLPPLALNKYVPHFKTPPNEKEDSNTGGKFQSTITARTINLEGKGRTWRCCYGTIIHR